jgi:hypothetical protein
MTTTRNKEMLYIIMYKEGKINGTLAEFNFKLAHMIANTSSDIGSIWYNDNSTKAKKNRSLQLQTQT